MKSSFRAAVLGGLVLGLATGLSIGPGGAGSNLNSSKSNKVTPVPNQTAEAACIKRGGVIILMDGRKMCSEPAAATNLNSSRSN